VATEAWHEVSSLKAGALNREPFSGVCSPAQAAIFDVIAAAKVQDGSD
jgi:hypothetical protein